MNDKLYWLAFSAFPGVGPVRFKLLVDYFGSAKKAWEASKKDLVDIHLGEKTTEKFDQFRRTFSVDGYARRLKEKEVYFLTLKDDKYPKLLREIPDPPFVLYVKGKSSHGRMDSPEVDKWDISKSIAVVGTRKITNYGREVTQFIVSQLVIARLTIVSGLAIGVDAAAHEAAIEAGGKTIAVLGCGVDCCNPRVNQWLYDKIIEGNGAVISEMPLSHFALKGLFPARNRIISGLSLGVLVVEGAGDSGALITARNAAEQGREVFAVPGPITSSLSLGPAQLIKKGAKLVTSASDILEELDIPTIPEFRGASKVIEGGTEEERAILKILEEERHFDEIVRMSEMGVNKIGSLLSMMEIKGMVRSLGGGVFKIA